MRNLYRKGMSFLTARNHWQTLTLFVGLMLFASMLSAQVTWTGATSDNFLVDDNWEPVGSPAGQVVTLPLIEYDSLGTLLSASKRSPILASEENLTITSLHMTGSAVDSLRRVLTINLGADDTLLVQNGGAGGGDINWNTANIIVNSGHVNFQGYERFEQNYRNWVINGGSVFVSRSSRTMQIGNSSTTTGGQFFISGGKLRVGPGGFGRNVWAREGGQFIITGDGVLEMEGDYTSWAQRIESGYVNGGENYIVKMEYDAVNSLTTFYALDKNFVFDISNTGRQIISAGETADSLKLLETAAVTTAKSFAWKYRLADATTWTYFTGEGANTKQFAPVFAEQGVYKVVCEIVTSENRTMITDTQVEFFVGSSAITINPYALSPANFNVQYVRLGEVGTQLSATTTGIASTFEWKYSKTPSGPYVSFETSAATDNVFSPSFTETGNHYVVLEAVIGGVTHRSIELYYIVEAATTANKSITWTGLISDDATNPGNWRPVAHPKKNSIVVNGLPNKYVTNDNGDTIETISPIYPVFRNTGNDTLSHIGCYHPAILTFDGPDTIYTSSAGAQPYITGTMNIKKGTILSKSWSEPTITNVYWNIHAATGYVNISGNSSMRVNTLLIGNKNLNDGGHVNLTDNGTLYVASLDRVVADTLESVISIADNAKYFQYGDVTSAIKSRIESGKIVCPQEGYEPYALFDGVWTVVTARNTTSFAIENVSRDFTTAGYPVKTPIGLVNVDGVTAWEWKWSTSIYGPWSSFEPAASNVATYLPSFAAPGNYYVVAETAAGVLTTNMKLISVVDLSVTPAAPQKVALGAACDELIVNLPSEVTFLSGAWFIYDEFGTEFETGVSDSAYLPAFDVMGLYEVFYFAEVQDENGISYTLYSNKVSINYGGVSANKIGANAAIKLYPNPVSSALTVEGISENSTIRIVNALGKQVMVKTATSSVATIDVAALNAGIYMLRAEKDGQVQTMKFVKQ